MGPCVNKRERSVSEQFLSLSVTGGRGEKEGGRVNKKGREINILAFLDFLESSSRFLVVFWKDVLGQSLEFCLLIPGIIFVRFVRRTIEKVAEEKQSVFSLISSFILAGKFFEDFC